MPECPRCKTICEPSAEKCDCGYELRLPAGMQPADMRRSLARFSGLKVAGIALIALTIPVWIVYIAAMRGSNLMGIFMVGMIPGTLVVIVVGLILLGAGSTRK